MNVFITGTTRGTGKTFISAGLSVVMQSLGYQAGVYKPFQIGAMDAGSFLVAPDLAFIKSIDPYIEVFNSYMMKTPAEPVLAAEVENINIDLTKISNDYKRINRQCDVVVVEGLGGLMEPVTQSAYMADVVKELNLSAVLIITPELGTINNTLMTINTANSMGVKLGGVIINKYPAKTNKVHVKAIPRMIEEYSDAKILGIVPELKAFELNNVGTIVDVILNNIDVEKVFNTTIQKLNL